MVGAGDVPLMGMRLAGLPHRRSYLHRPYHPPVIEYQFTLGMAAAAAGGLNGFRAADCASSVAVTAGGAG